MLGLLVAPVIAVAIALRSEPGQNTWRFGQGALIEIRKVVWPTRQETTQTTLIVMAMVFAVGVDPMGVRHVSGVGCPTADRPGGLNGMALRWYVVHAYSGFENQVKQSLEERVKR